MKIITAPEIIYILKPGDCFHIMFEKSESNLIVLIEKRAKWVFSSNSEKFNKYSEFFKAKIQQNISTFLIDDQRNELSIRILVERILEKSITGIEIKFDFYAIPQE